MSAFVIPSIFTAIDKFSAPIKGMGRNLQVFSDKADSVISRSEHMFHKMKPSHILGEAGSELLSFAKTAAIAGGIVEGIHFAYESAERYENAIIGLEAASNAGSGMMEQYEENINKVAEATGRGSSETAEAFKTIGQLNPELYKNAEALGEVTKASIILSQATKSDLGASAEDLTQIMRAFNTPAEDASKVINTMVAASNQGGISYRQLADSMKNIGETTRNANLSFEQTASAIATINSKTNLGEASGSALQKVIVKLEKAHIGYKNGVFDLGGALDATNKKMEHMNEKERDAMLNKLGLKGANIDAARALLNNKDAYDRLTKGITGTDAAQEKSAIMMNSVTGTWTRLKGAFDRMINGSKETGSALNFVKDALGFVAEHMVTIFKVIGFVIGAFIAWKAIMIAARIAMIAYNVVMGINAALTGQSAFVTMGSTVAYGAYRTVVVLSTAAQWALNAAMEANPIGIIVAALMALVAALYAVYAHYKLLEEIYNKASNEAKITAINKETKAVQDLSAAYQKQGMSKAEADARATKGTVAHLDATSGVLKEQLKSSILDVAKTQSNPFSTLKAFFTGDKELQNMYNVRGALDASEGSKAALLNPKAAQNAALANSVQTNNSKVDININDPGGKVSDAQTSGQGMISVKTTSTLTGR